MRSRIFLPLMASLMLSASAAPAGDTTPPAAAGHRMHMSQEDMAKHHTEMCTNLYAHAVGKLAELEARLQLTSVEKPLFERWKNVRLASAKAHAEKCGTFTFPGRDASIMDKLKLEQSMLETRLADLKAETPSLQALADSLTKDQQRILERAAMKAHHERMEFMGHMHHRMGDRMMHGMRDRDGMHGDNRPEAPDAH
jgi:hypothetical protein